MIDEKKIINDIKQWSKEREIKWTTESVISLLESAPKIGGWIPCSERLPTKKECGNYRGNFLVTVYTNKLTTLYMEYEYTTIRGKEVGRWLWNDRVNIPWEVIAWQPLPEAYHE